jgi:hypothetical protein
MPFGHLDRTGHQTALREPITWLALPAAFFREPLTLKAEKAEADWAI